MWPDCFVIIFKLYKDYLAHWKKLAAIPFCRHLYAKLLGFSLYWFLRKTSTSVKIRDPFLTAKFMTLSFMRNNKIQFRWMSIIKTCSSSAEMELSQSMSNVFCFIYKLQWGSILTLSVEETGVDVLWWSRSTLSWVCASCNACTSSHFNAFSSSLKAKCIFLCMEVRGANPALQKSGEGNAVFYTLESEDCLENRLLLFKFSINYWNLRILCHLTTEVTAEGQRLTNTLGYSESASGCAPQVHNCISVCSIDK